MKVAVPITFVGRLVPVKGKPEAGTVEARVYWTARAGPILAILLLKEIVFPVAGAKVRNASLSLKASPTPASYVASVTVLVFESKLHEVTVM